MLRAACVLFVVSLLGSQVAAAGAADVDGIVIEGVGSAHGFGMAMDGVEGQARAGWAHDRILDLFYPDSVAGGAGGVIRVGLGAADVQRVTLPGGGTVSDAPPGVGAAFRDEVAPASIVTVAQEGGRLVVGGFASASSEEPEQEPPAEEPDATPPPLPTSSPPGEVTLEPTPSPTPEPTPEPPAPLPSAPPPPSSSGSIWVVPAGDPALAAVEATGRRYRGSIEIRLDASGRLIAVNHVDLETYVAGIAEEKGQGWPVEGLKALAVAARSLGDATMSWYGRNQADGFDICATGNCQVYLGYDGEEPAMRRAAAETAGRIRTYKGSAILAMYHGNGGGVTESYARMAGKPEDVHPYLRSVRYPHGDPKRWRRETSMPEIARALATDEEVAARASVPAPLERIEVVERGESPRVVRVRLSGGGREQVLAGRVFARAIGLPSTWFVFPHRSAATVEVLGRAEPHADVAVSSTPEARARRPWGVAASFATLAVVAAGVLEGRRRLDRARNRANET